MNIIDVINCLTYSLSVTIAIMFLIDIRATIKLYMYFVIVFLCDLITFGPMEQYSMVLIIAALILFMTKKEHVSFLSSLLFSTTAVLLVLLPLLVLANVITLVIPSLLGTALYNVIMGVLLTSAVLAGRRLIQRIGIHLREFDKHVSLITLSFNILFLLLFTYLIPNLSDKPFMTVYAVFSFMFVLTTVFLLFIMNYIIKMEHGRAEKEKQYTLLQSTQHTIEQKYNDMIVFKHYYLGLYKAMTGFITEYKWDDLIRYFSKHIAPISEQLTAPNQAGMEMIDRVKLPLLKNVISANYMQCISKNIKFYLVVENIIDKINIEETKLIAILNIFFENAVEACQENHGEIRLSIRDKKNYIEITLKNTYNKTENLKKALAYTKGAHRGNGIKLVQIMLEQETNVLWNTTIANGMFIQELIIIEDAV